MSNSMCVYAFAYRLEDSGINDESVKHLMDGVRFSGSLKALRLEK